MELLKTEILNPDLKSRTPDLADEFASAEPYRHVVIPDFFSEEFSRRLMEDFPSFDERIARNEAGNPGRKAVQSKVRDISPAFQELDDFIQTSEFLDMISDITGIPDLLYDPEYTGGGTHENLDGQGLDPHVDFNYHPRTGWHRRLNLIVYLNPEWEESWGGNFDLHSDPWEPRHRPDEDGAAACSTGASSSRRTSTPGTASRRSELPEEHKDASRRSFAIYLYTKDRPAEETAASHATIYVPRPIPDDVKPGVVLDDKAYQGLTQRFTLAREHAPVPVPARAAVQQADRCTPPRARRGEEVTATRSPGLRDPDQAARAGYGPTAGHPRSDIRVHPYAGRCAGCRLDVMAPSQLEAPQHARDRRGSGAAPPTNSHRGSARSFNCRSPPMQGSTCRGDDASERRLGAPRTTAYQGMIGAGLQVARSTRRALSSAARLPSDPPVPEVLRALALHLEHVVADRLRQVQHLLLGEADPDPGVRFRRHCLTTPGT